jgi:hypothetical protein
MRAAQRYQNIHGNLNVEWAGNSTEITCDLVSGKFVVTATDHEDATFKRQKAHRTWFEAMVTMTAYYNAAVAR